MKVLGCMSGTSHDGIDVAAVDLSLDGDTLTVRLMGMRSSAYSPPVLSALEAVLPPATTTAEAVCRLDTLLGQAYADAFAVADRELCGGEAELAVCHGQTVFHWVDGGRVLGTLQLGQPAWIAERTGLPVVSDLRTRDVAAGGQGAPLVSYVDALLLAGRPGRSAALNLGGIANLTVGASAVAGGAGGVLAFDTGPGNLLIDAAVAWRTGGAEPMDRDGRRAARGRVRDDLLAALLADPYFDRPPPKTTGRERFHLGYLCSMAAGLSSPVDDDDLVATVTALTAHTVASAARSCDVTELVVSGGGVRNPTLMASLRSLLPGVELMPSDALGVPAQAKEAVAFAILGFLTWHGLPATLPSATGASHPSVLGSVTPGGPGASAPGAGGASAPCAWGASAPGGRRSSPRRPRSLTPPARLGALTPPARLRVLQP